MPVARISPPSRSKDQDSCGAGVLSLPPVSVDPRKVQSIVEGATPTSRCEVRRFTGLGNYYRRFLEGYAEVAAPLTALGSPTARF